MLPACASQNLRELRSSMQPLNLELAAARVSLGVMVREELPAVALQALEDGHDSTSLRLLAGLCAAEMDEALPLFQRALSEIGMPLPPKDSAVMSLSRDMARKIVNGETAPYNGAKAIWGLARLQDEDDLVALNPFIGFASEWEDSPDYRESYERAIVEQARALLGNI
jgi:hypothetical protein